MLHVVPDFSPRTYEITDTGDETCKKKPSSSEKLAAQSLILFPPFNPLPPKEKESTETDLSTFFCDTAHHLSEMSNLLFPCATIAEEIGGKGEKLFEARPVEEPPSDEGRRFQLDTMRLMQSGSALVERCENLKATATFLEDHAASLREALRVDRIRQENVRELRKRWVLRRINKRAHIVWGSRGFGNAPLNGRDLKRSQPVTAEDSVEEQTQRAIAAQASQWAQDAMSGLAEAPAPFHVLQASPKEVVLVHPLLSSPLRVQRQDQRLVLPDQPPLVSRLAEVCLLTAVKDHRNPSGPLTALVEHCALLTEFESGLRQLHPHCTVRWLHRSTPLRTNLQVNIRCDRPSVSSPTAIVANPSAAAATEHVLLFECDGGTVLPLTPDWPSAITPTLILEIIRAILTRNGVSLNPKQ
ncbi:hypothetical protein PAPYR_47 [Paratrimastix pyriformis]|uniref:Mediator of RNA polymerase II transcription subunit 17 n=1 Tax=Paratrimastix pyriformis TaxID=342808 RepID=A0ABQ8UUR1_9EUKA|nr:hypothetical protein PAPYR_47 [Paratrimastix pyriformis]